MAYFKNPCQKEVSFYPRLDQDYQSQEEDCQWSKTIFVLQIPQI
jgi:hypothetical protein